MTEEFDRVEPLIVPSASVHPRWSQLLTGFQTEVAWQIFKSTVQTGLIGDAGMAVPFLTESRQFHIGQLVQKWPQTVSEMIAGAPPQYGLIGPLRNFISFISPEAQKKFDSVDFAPHWDRQEDFYRLYLADKGIEEGPVDKSIHLTIKKTKKFGMKPIGPWEVQLDLKRLPRVSPSVYLVVDVFVSPLIVVDLTIGEETHRFRYADSVPVGFALKKYRLDPDGWIAPIDNKLTTLKSTAIWRRGPVKEDNNAESSATPPQSTKFPQLYRPSPKTPSPSSPRTPVVTTPPSHFTSTGKTAFLPQCRHTEVAKRTTLPLLRLDPPTPRPTGQHSYGGFSNGEDVADSHNNT